MAAASENLTQNELDALRGQVQREAGRDGDAAKTYEDILTRIDKQKELKDEDKSALTDHYRYVLSSIYVDLNQVDKATEHLQDSPDPGGLALGSFGPVTEGVFIWTAGLGALLAAAVWIGAKVR